MNPYQVIAVIIASMLVFAGFVTALALMGLPLLGAFLAVYLTTLWIMAGMQKRARQYCSYREQRRSRLFGCVDNTDDLPAPFLPEKFNIYQDAEPAITQTSQKSSSRGQAAISKVGLQGTRRLHFVSAIKSI